MTVRVGTERPIGHAADIQLVVADEDELAPCGRRNIDLRECGEPVRAGGDRAYRTHGDETSLSRCQPGERGQEAHDEEQHSASRGVKIIFQGSLTLLDACSSAIWQRCNPAYRVLREEAKSKHLPNGRDRLRPSSPRATPRLVEPGSPSRRGPAPRGGSGERQTERTCRRASGETSTRYRFNARDGGVEAGERQARRAPSSHSSPGRRGTGPLNAAAPREDGPVCVVKAFALVCRDELHLRPFRQVDGLVEQEPPAPHSSLERQRHTISLGLPRAGCNRTVLRAEASRPQDPSLKPAPMPLPRAMM